jgi:hypothetical protein
MNMSIQFDTLTYAKKLSSAGIPVPQAEAHAAALGDALASTAVARGELSALEQNLLSAIKLGEQHIHGRLERMDLRQGADMKHVYWMMSTLILLNLGILSKLMLQ